MNIIVIGGGEVGESLCSIFSEQGYNVTLIEESKSVASRVDETLNIKVLNGNGCSAQMLMEAKVADCDYLFSMTNLDRVNILSCSIAKALGAKCTVARIQDVTYADHNTFNYQLHFGIDLLVSPHGLCAVEIAKKIRNPNRVAVENFARGQIEVQAITLDKQSKFVNHSLKDLQLDSNIRIGYLRRKGALLIPTKDTVLCAEDIITLVGPPEVLFEYKPKFNPSFVHDMPHVVLFGATDTAVTLIRLLKNSRFRMKLIEENRELCESLAEKFPDVSIINGEATSLRLLEEEQIENCDHFVACSPNDEENIMACLQAKRLGIKNIYLVVNRADYQDMFADIQQFLGVNLVVSPRIATANELRNFVSTAPFISLGTLGDDGEILEIKISSQSVCSGQKIKDIPWPMGSVMVALAHKFQIKMPGAQDTLIGGDRAVFIVRKENIQKLVDLLT
jgi:trk system potassium uptake protein